MKIDKFIKSNHLTITTKKVQSRPDQDSVDVWGETASHYKVTISSATDKFSCYFSQGIAHTKPPTLADVLDCLASDCSTVDSLGSFEEWAIHLGYDADSRKDEKLYKTIIKQARELKDFLGNGAYQELLFDVERL
jgi:hypothetical protein